MQKYDHLDALTDGEAIVRNPAMFVGDLDDPTHLFSEVYDNALDEAIEGHADTIRISIDDTSFEISDNGRGMPQGIHEKTGLHYPILAATKLFSGGKFNNSTYKIHMGLHGVGLTCVNYLSDYCRIETRRNDKIFSVDFDYGKAREPIIANNTSNITGTTVKAVPSAKIFGTTKINEETVRNRCRLAVTFLDVNISINGEKVEPFTDAELCPGADTPVISVSVELENGEGAIAYLAYDTKGSKTDLNQGSVNLLRVNEGAHIKSFEWATMLAWQELFDQNTKEYLSIRDSLVGARGFVLFFLLDPKYRGQTKEALAGRYEQYDHITHALSKKILERLKEKSFAPYRKALESKFKDYRKHINEIHTSTFLDEVLRFGDKDDAAINRSLKLDSKLFDSSSPKREGTELFIVEGDSAGGSLVKERDSKIHAVLPLRGKSLNVVDKELKRILDNIEIRSLVNAIGCGVRHKEDVSRIRYGKIIIASDADNDGYQIQALLIGALCYLVPETVRTGHVYIAQAPLFGQYDGKKWIPVYSQEELNRNKSFERYKGLGSMETWQLASVLFDEKIRRLTQIAAKDVKKVEKLVGYSAFKKELLKEKGVIK